MEGIGQIHASAALSLGKEAPVTHWIVGWVDPRAGPDAVKREEITFLSLLGIEPRLSSP